MVHREVGGSNSESQGITQVVDSLDNAIGINIAVSIVELTIVILGMELVVGSIHCSSHHRHSSRGNCLNWGSSSNWCHSWGSSNSNWGSSWGINLMHREVGGSNPEPQGITQVVDSLDNAIGINIAVASSGDSISSLHFLL